jgi:hypothetical protein
VLSSSEPTGYCCVSCRDDNDLADCLSVKVNCANKRTGSDVYVLNRCDFWSLSCTSSNHLLVLLLQVNGSVRVESIDLIRVLRPTFAVRRRRRRDQTAVTMPVALASGRRRSYYRQRLERVTTSVRCIQQHPMTTDRTKISTCVFVVMRTGRERERETSAGHCR